MYWAFVHLWKVYLVAFTEKKMKSHWLRCLCPKILSRSYIRLCVQIHFLQTYWVYLVSPIYTIRCMAIHWSALDLPMSILLKSSYRLLIGPQLGTGIHMSYPFPDWLFVLCELSQVFSLVSESLCILYGPALLCPEKKNQHQLVVIHWLCFMMIPLSWKERLWYKSP